jgi:hypothetical protein
MSPWGRRALLGMVVAVVLAAASCGGDDGGDEEDSPDAIRRADGVEAGDCYQQPEDERTTVAPVSCEAAHDNEAFAAFQLPDGAYPGDRRVLSDGRAGCFERFEGFVGVPYEDSGLDVDALTPTRLTWEEGDRKVVCILFNVNGEQLEGSAQGSGG